MITIREQCWDRAAAELGGLSAEAAAEALRILGHAVDVVDGDWGPCYYADTDAEHWAVSDL